MTTAGLPIGKSVDGEFDDPLELSTRTAEDGTIVLTAAGEVDTFTAPPLCSLLDAQLERQPPTLVLDLSGIRFLGSAGLAALVETHKTARDRGIALRLVATNRPVIRPLEVTGLIDMFTFAGEGEGEGDERPRQGSRTGSTS